MPLNKKWKAISKISMTSEFDQSKCISGRVYDADVPVEAFSGNLVVVGPLDAHQYANTYFDYDLNVHQLTLPAAQTDEVAIIDFSDRPYATNGDLEYAVGFKLMGMPVPAGTVTRVRVLERGDKFRLADGNFTAAPTVGGYAA